MNDNINTVADMYPDARARERGLEIAVRFPVTHDREFWSVPHPPSRSFKHRVTLGGSLPECRCSCPEFEATWRPCCHIHAARYAQMRESGLPVPVPEYPADVPPGAPAWITGELIREMLRVMSVNYPERLTPTDAMAMLIAVGQLAELG